MENTIKELDYLLENQLENLSSEKSKVFGPDSTIAKAMQALATNSGEKGLAEKLLETFDNVDRLEEKLNLLCTDDSRKEFELQQRVTILKSLTRICTLLSSGKKPANNLQQNASANARIEHSDDESHGKVKFQPAENWLANSIKPLNTIRLPLLLVNDGRSGIAGGKRTADKGVVVELIIDRFDNSELVFAQKPGCLGLTVISREQEKGQEVGFATAIDNAWVCFCASMAKSNRSQGFRWAIKSHLRESTSRACLSRLHHRSCEAAYVCALWAAAGGIQGKQSSDDQLDEFASISATLDELNMHSPEETLLKGVGGLSDKISAAIRCGITLIVVANSQWNEEKDSIIQAVTSFNSKKSNWQEECHIVGADTIGEAYEVLTSSHNILQKHHAAVSAAWLNQWDEDPETGLSTGIWRGSDEYKQAVEKAKAEAVDPEAKREGDR